MSRKITKDLEKRYSLGSAAKKRETEAYHLRKVDPSKGDIKKQMAAPLKEIAQKYLFLSFNEYRTLLSLYHIRVDERKGAAKGTPFHGFSYPATEEHRKRSGVEGKSTT